MQSIYPYQFQNEKLAQARKTISEKENEIQNKRVSEPFAPGCLHGILGLVISVAIGYIGFYIFWETEIDIATVFFAVCVFVGPFVIRSLLYRLTRRSIRKNNTDLDRQLEEFISETNDEVEKEIENQREAFFNTAYEMSKKYQHSKNIEKLSENMLPFFIGSILALDRRSNVQFTRLTVGINVFNQSVTCEIGQEIKHVYVFSSLKIADLADSLEVAAAAYALSAVLTQKIRENGNDSIPDKNIKVTFSELEEIKADGYSSYSKPGIKVYLTYSGENSGYMTENSWILGLVLKIGNGCIISTR